jgi:hypothetical protein
MCSFVAVESPMTPLSVNPYPAFPISRDIIFNAAWAEVIASVRLLSLVRLPIAVEKTVTATPRMIKAIAIDTINSTSEKPGSLRIESANVALFIIFG